MYNAFQFQVSTTLDPAFESLTKSAQLLFNENSKFLSKVLPELYSMLLDTQGKRYSLFYSDTGILNLRDNQSGEALYSRYMYQEIESEVKSFLASPVSIAREFLNSEDSVKGMPDKAAVVVFGVGCGYHLKLLLESGKLSALIIYEADLDLLKTSLYFTSWAELFALAELNSVLLAVQPGSAVADIKFHLAQLVKAGLFNEKVYIYRHTYHVLAEEVFRFLLASSGNQNALIQGEGRFLGLSNPLDYLPVRPAGVLGNIVPNFSIDKQHKELFDKNLKKLSELYPEIANFYNNYKPQRWVFFQDPNGQHNIYHLPSKTLAYHDSTQQSARLAQLFIENPYRETPIYTQTYQDKLAVYIHFQKIFEVEKLQQRLNKPKHHQLEEVRTVAFFGSGLAKHIEYTLEKVQPKNIFIFEQDPDLFFASLYVTDWAGILNKIELGKGHIYFNIGCAPDYYLSYFLYQLHIIGAYELSNTFLFPSYYRPQLQKAVSELRKQLKTFIGLNEYYDNARYAITHFTKNAANGALFMRDSLVGKLNYPVFIVGNGPSLDSLIPYIVENKDNALIISCGTALKALYEYGIKPDFHAEVEQNSATFGWITKVPSRDYLKSINFISTSAAYPDTVSLFKNAYLAFSFGQAPYKLLKRLESDELKNISQLRYAFPTVSNFAVDFVSRIGFSDVYLFGVDLGVVDLNHHHSKKSVYYNESGKDVYNLSTNFNNPIVINGNFGARVYTKFEFDMARRIMEQTISANESKTNFYNCSNGAMILGSTPLMPENILIDKNNNKDTILYEFLNLRFEPISPALVSKLNALVASELKIMSESISSWVEVSNERVNRISEIDDIIFNHTKKFKDICKNRNSLGCLLLEGSALSFLGLMNSFSSTLKSEDSEGCVIFNQLLDIWLSYLNSILEDCNLILTHSCRVFSESNS